MLIELNNIDSGIDTDRNGITFFVPCLDEENNIKNTLEAIKGAVKKVKIDYEILIFDDNSNDNTLEEIRNYCKNNIDIDVKLILNPKTMGLGRNYVDGSYIAQYRYYVCIFGGNSEPENTIVSLLESLGKADIIIPNYDISSRTLLRRMFSTSFTFLVNFISGNSIKYYNWSVVHLKKNVMRWHSDTNGFAYQAEIITKLIQNDCTYIELTLKNSDEHKGSSNAFRIQNILSVLHSLGQIFLRRLRKSIFNV